MAGKDGIKADSISKLRKYIEDEEFETDSLKLDVSANFDGNIARDIADQKLARELFNFIQQNECMYFPPLSGSKTATYKRCQIF